MRTGKANTDWGAAISQPFSEDQLIISNERMPSIDEAQVGNLSGREASRRAPNPSFCNYIMAVGVAILILGGFGGSSGCFFLYKSTKRFKEWPSDQDSLLDFHTGAVLLGITFFVVLGLTAVGSLAACSRTIQEVRGRQMAMQRA